MEERQDALALEIVEDLYYFVDNKIKLLAPESPQRRKLEDIKQTLASERRLIEEISLPCRFLLEHLTEMQVRGAAVELETETCIQGKAPITGIHVQEWAKIRLSLGSLDVCWRDTGSRYYFYPDKVEIRTGDERTGGFKLFFSFPFNSSLGLMERFPSIDRHGQVAYWHPDLDKSER